MDAISGTNLYYFGSIREILLEFPHRRIGDTVRIIVKEEGYVVVNDVQLETVLPATPKLATDYYPCKEADREEMARRFYRLKSFDVIEETYQRKVRKFEETHQADATALASLQKERDQAKAAAEKSAEVLANAKPGTSLKQPRPPRRRIPTGSGAQRWGLWSRTFMSTSSTSMGAKLQTQAMTCLDHGGMSTRACF